ncbi:MAG: metallophosphoesterase [Clostridia bacterium]|nr:metallophosphoesterase [Clostridia bacterium]
MKRHFIFIISIIAALALSVCLVSATEAYSESDISSLISGANDGDTVNITLENDIEITKNIEISKDIVLNVYFNGNQLNYTGSTTDNLSYGAFYINSADATVNLYGSSKLNDYASYTHYDDTVKPDMTGMGNLIVILNGELNLYDMYMYSGSNAFAIVGDMVDNNDYSIYVKDSVLRAPEGSSKSAMAHEGGNSSNSAVKKRAVVAENSVLYGGFKGINYAYNLTVGTSFTNVKFYDFYIKNDCWYDTYNSSVLPLIMNSFEKSANYVSCIFNNYDETVGNITINTETGKQNFKLIGCTFNSIVSGEKFQGDRGGDAYVYVLDSIPTCLGGGTMLVCKNGSALYESTYSKGAHEFSDFTPTYPNGYTNEGIYLKSCSYCGITETGEKCEPLFVNLGYSTNEENTNMALGTRINREMLDKFLSKNPNEQFDFGVIAGNTSTTVELVNGEVLLSEGGIKASLKNLTPYSIVNLKLVNIAKEFYSKKVMLEFYISDGEKIEYSDGALNYLSLEDLNIMIEEEKKEAVKFLESKIPLYYNDDGSFRVMVIADAHMNVDADATKVQAVKDRIKLLVDRVEPNLIIFTGDNVIGSSSEEKLRRNIDAIVGYIEEKEIPWCHVYGNHDHEGSLSNAQQQPIFESYEYCVSKAGPEDVSGTGNYALGVYNKDGTLGSVVYCLDSGAYANGGYDYIKQDQIDWYKESSELIEAYAGKTVPAIMAFHIPLIENNTAHNQRDNKEIVYEYSGNKNENICASATDTELLETIFKRGDVKAIVTGHDHVNDYMYNYLGVKLTSSPNVSDLTYTNANVQGSRVFDLNVETLDDIPTYVEYVIERINPDDYGTLADNTTLFENNSFEASYSGYDQGSINGTVTISSVDGAIEVLRSAGGNYEIYIDLGKDAYGKLGENKYLIVWVDFTNVEFRKACFGLLTNDGNSCPYRTDDHDSRSSFYYLADGTSEWVTLSHGGDGCFGTGDSGSQGMKGKKGYLALPIEYFKEGSKVMNSETLVTGLYMYADVNDGAGKPYYLDNVMLVTDYKTAILP